MSCSTHGWSATKRCEPKSLFSLPPEVRQLIYEYLLLSPIPLPPTPPQSRQYVYTAILRTNHRIYLEAVNLLYKRNDFAVHLRSNLHKVAYEPFLSALTKSNAEKIKEVEIVLWGSYNADEGDTVHFGAENFCVALQNLVYAPKLVVAVDLVMTGMEAQGDSFGAQNFCAFDWLMATFADEWFFSKTRFDLFRGVVRFHMKKMFLHRRIKTCESRWFREARATPGLQDHELRTLRDLEERYGLPHDDGEEEEEEDRSVDSVNEDTPSDSNDEETIDGKEDGNVEGIGEDEK